MERASWLIFFPCAVVLLWIQRTVNSSLSVVRNNAQLTSVPQDVDISVTILTLEYNYIIVIGSSSLGRYHYLKELSLSYNPLEDIQTGTFDNNPELQWFKCMSCQLSRFPQDFGPASTSLTRLSFHFGIRDIAAFSELRLDRFTSLIDIRLRGLKGINFDSIRLPRSLASVDIGKINLVTFPNLSFARFPNLKFIILEGNVYEEGTNFLGMTEAMTWIIAGTSNLYSAEGVDLLPNLERLFIANNLLETIPDLLGLPVLRMLSIEGNSRMNCDQRMCWRRLWDRMRNPLQRSDDVTCVEPPLLAGNKMTKVNPKFMQCSNGEQFLVAKLSVPMRFNIKKSAIHAIYFFERNRLCRHTS